MQNKTAKIMRLIAEQIEIGNFPAGSKLPSERKLSELHGIGRGAVRAIFDALAADGLIERNHAGKPVVCLRVPEKKKKLLAITYDLMGFPNKLKAMLIYQAMCRRAAELHYEIDNYFSSYSNLTSNQYRSILDGRYQGVLFNEMVHYPTVKNLLDHNIPCIVANCESTLDFPQVRSDWRAVGRMAGEELLRYGHREIAAISGDPSQAIYQELIAGFRGALAEANVSLPDSRIIAIDAWSQDDPKYLERIRPLLYNDNPVTAFFAARDRRAVFLIRACLLWHLEIPKNFSVIGFDNQSWCGSEIYQLTTFTEENALVGTKAVDLLHQWIVTGKRPESLILPSKIIERASIIPRRDTLSPATMPSLPVSSTHNWL